MQDIMKELIIKFASEENDIAAFSLYDGDQAKDVVYQDFAKDILSAVAYFKKSGMQNQHIGIAAPNSYDWVVTFFAAILSGNVAVLMNPALPKDTLLWQCEKADVSVVFSESDMAFDDQEKSNVDMLTFKDITGMNPVSVEDVCSRDLDDTVVLMFTSGTTGKSKAVEITLRNLYVCIYTMCFMREQEGTIDAPGAERVYFGYPMFHIAGLKVMLRALYQTATICMGRGIRYMFADFKMLNPTHISLVPMSVESAIKIMKQTDKVTRKAYFGDKLTRVSSGGAAMKIDVVNYLIEQGYTVETAYGMTETTGVGTWRVLDGTHIGSLGRIGGETQCRIQDGEILFKTAGIMKGYYKDPEETSKIIEDGWIHTGDLGYCDEDGYYYITGRKKNVIILSNGENVNPEEIEARWGSCGAILECLVYGDGKGICADVYTDDESAAADFIKQYNEGMPFYRQVYKVNYMKEPLEKTGTGKIKRKENVYV